MAFALVFAGHMLGDWVVQTDQQALHKTHSWSAMLGHILTYHLVLGCFLLPYFGWGWLTYLVVSATTHAFLDRRWPVRWFLVHTGSSSFSKTTLGVLAADQALHLTVLVISLPLLGVSNG